VANEDEARPFRDLAQDDRRPVPDPTILTTQALYREVSALQELIELSIKGTREVIDQQFYKVEQQFEFIVDAGIVIAMVGMLMAPPRTPLYHRMEKEGRLVDADGPGAALINAGMSTNIVPLQMTRDELARGTEQLHRDLLDDRIIYRRLVQKLRYLDNPPNYTFDPGEWQSIFFGLVRDGILEGGPRRCWYFAATVLYACRRPMAFVPRMRTVIANWSYALSLRDYVERTLGPRARDASPDEWTSQAVAPNAPAHV
jgi:hypothetical protein